MTRTRVFVGAALVGLAALTVVLAYLSLNQSGIAKIVGYQHYGDERGIVVIVAVGALTDIAERNVEEDATTVKVTVHSRQSPGTYPSYLIFLPVAIPLHDGLHERRVVDQDGMPVADLGVYQRPSASPRP